MGKTPSSTVPGSASPEKLRSGQKILPAGPAPAAPSHRVYPYRTALALALIVLAVGLVQLTPTFGLAYAYDDLDCLNLAADVMAGKEDFWRLAFRPHNEHLMPLMRVAFQASAAWFGIDARPFRLAVFGAHLLTAWLLGMLALHYTRRPIAAIATGVAYVLPSGLSSMMLWVLVATGVPIGLVGVTGALLALAHRDALGVRRARLLAGAGCVFALLAGSGLMPLLVGPLLLDELERRRAGERRLLGPFAIFCVLAMGVCALATAWSYADLHGSRPALHLVQGLPGAAFLLALTPYRYLFPGLGLPLATTQTGNLLLWSSLALAIAAPIAAALVALWHRATPPLAKVAALAAVGPLGVLVLVGAGRSNASPSNLFEADRYFFTLLLPLALLAGAAAASVAGRLQSWTPRQRAAVIALCAVAVGAELLLHRRALMLRVPFGVFAQHERRFDQLERLAQDLSTAASNLEPGAPPLVFPDGSLWFHDVHNGRVSARLLLHVIGAEGAEGAETPRLQLASGPLTEREAAILNPLLATWATAMGEPQAAPKVVAGALTRADAPEIIDFREGAQDAAVVSGFYPWEGSYRWMAGRGSLRIILKSNVLQLTLVAPMSELRAKLGWDAIAVSVTAFDEVTHTAVPLGSVRIVQDGQVTYPLDLTPFRQRFGAKAAIVELTADRTWRPNAVVPESVDERDLSVIVVAVASAP